MGSSVRHILHTTSLDSEHISDDSSTIDYYFFVVFSFGFCSFDVVGWFICLLVPEDDDTTGVDIGIGASVDVGDRSGVMPNVIRPSCIFSYFPFSCLLASSFSS